MIYSKKKCKFSTNLIRISVELALLAVFAICFDHPKSSDNRIPRYGFSVTC